jgi:hypothetical protein
VAGGVFDPGADGGVGEPGDGAEGGAVDAGALFVGEVLVAGEAAGHVLEAGRAAE